MLKKIKNIFYKEEKVKYDYKNQNFEDNFNSLDADIILIKIGSDIVPFIDNFYESIFKTRDDIKQKTGFIIPLIRTIDSNEIQENEILVYIRDKEIYQNFLICKKEEIEKEIEKIVKNIFDKHLEEIFSNEILEQYIRFVQKKNDWLIWSITRILFVGDIRYLLISLLKNGKSIKNISYIFEKIGDILNCDFRYGYNVNLSYIENKLLDIV